MIKLYGTAMSRAARSLWALAEVGQRYEHIPISPLPIGKGDTRKPEFLEINPNGHIPVLDDLLIDAGEFKATFIRYPEKGSPEHVSLPNRNPYEQELRLFGDCIVGKADPALLSAERAREALTLSIATQQSLRKHRGVDPRFIR